MTRVHPVQRVWLADACARACEHAAGLVRHAATTGGTSTAHANTDVVLSPPGPMVRTPALFCGAALPTNPHVNALTHAHTHTPQKFDIYTSSSDTASGASAHVVVDMHRTRQLQVTNNSKQPLVLLGALLLPTSSAAFTLWYSPSHGATPVGQLPTLSSTMLAQT